VHTDRWLDVLFGKGDDTYPFWLLTVRLNILLFVLCTALVIAWNLSPVRLRRLRGVRMELCLVVGLTAVAAGLRFVVAGANLMDYGGIAYSRMLRGYKGYFATAQFFSLFYELTARDLEHAVLLDRIAGTLTIPLVYVLCRRLQPNAKLWPPIAAFLFAVYPLHILFSASDVLAVFSCFVAAASYVLLATPMAMAEEHPVLAKLHYLGGFAGLALLTQVRYENVLLLIPAALVLTARRTSLRRGQLVLPLAASMPFVVVYAVAAATSGTSYQNPMHLWPGVDRVTWHLALNPFLAVPVLFLGTLAVWACAGWRLGVLALLPWVGAFVLAGWTTDSGHSAARIYANWLILILPLSGYGFSRMLDRPGRSAKAVAAVALCSLASQPVIFRDRLAAQYLDIVEHERFRALLTSLPPSVRWVIVPDDDVMSRQPHSTFEAYQKYAMILEGRPEVARRILLVGLTEYLEHPQPARCPPGACVFFFGLPCMEPNVYRFARGECEELLHTHAASVLDETTVVTAPFVDCSIYAGTLREQLCDPVTTPQRFTVYWIEE
jgi:hypothetical protein